MEFIFTAGEQAFYAEKGFQNEPGRCPDCREQRRRDREGYSRGPRQLVDVVCDSCGAPTQVPFQPTQGRPVYCRDCFSKANTGSVSV